MRRIRRRRWTALLGAGVCVALTAAVTAPATAQPGRPDLEDLVEPIDPQQWENPDDMTWDDYTAVPGIDWSDPEREGSEQNFNIALVLGDFTDQPFLVTQAEGAHPFGNPQAGANGLDRSDVAEFYEGFLNTPGELNRGHTLHEYWMEDSAGRYGVDLTAHGVYAMPGKLHEYGLAGTGQNGAGCPAGDNCDKSIRDDLGGAWRADVGDAEADSYDLVFFMTAGHDESGTWQEFGEMMFASPQDVPDEFGPPDDSLPNSVSTRYIDWTSWLAGSNHWPNASSGSSTQAESSGAGVYAHELSHLLGIGDNYNNPYGEPVSRSYSGIWSMLARGSFNGPGGPHRRWVVPATEGGSMGAHHMLRNKMKLDMVDAGAASDPRRAGRLGRRAHRCHGARGADRAGVRPRRALRHQRGDGGWRPQPGLQPGGRLALRPRRLPELHARGRRPDGL